MPMSLLSHDGNKSEPGGTGKVTHQDMNVRTLSTGYGYDGEVGVESPQAGDGTLFSRVEVNGDGHFELLVTGRPERVHFGFFVNATSVVRTSANVPLGCVATLNAVWEVRNVNTGQGMQRQTAFFTNTVQDPASWVDDTGFELNLQPGQYRFVFTLVAVANASSAEESHEVFINLKGASFTLRLL